MPKRSAESQIEYYNAKIRKLKRRKQRRRVIVYSSSSDSEEHSDNGATNVETHDDTAASTTSVPDASTVTPPIDTISPPELEILAPPIPELEPELLEALGEPCDDVPVYGMDIHEKLAQRWLPILKKGLEKNTKENLLKEFAIPSNCRLLKAPSLNAEISAAVSEIVRTRDKKLQNKQDQLGLGITAVNRGMSLLLTGNDKVQAVKLISDGCRILSDLHFVETQVRTKLITPGLDKAFWSVIQDQDRDETLYGNTLPEKIKASKAIAKQGQQIKKVVIPKSSPSSSTFSGFRARQQGNWSGPPRYPPSNRGGAHSSLQNGGVTPLPPCAASPAAAVDSVGVVDGHQQTCSNPAVTQDITMPSETVYPGCSSALRTAFIERGTPNAALEIMMASLSKNTLQQYSVTYKLWWCFCNTNDLNPYMGSPSSIMVFLTEQYHKGDTYGSLNNHRSALSLLLGSDLTSNDLVKRLLKGVYKLRPAVPKYKNTWDPQTVLNFVANWIPNRDLSIEKNTKKLVVLLALCTAHRVQTLSLIKLENIIERPSGIEIGITDVIKTSASGRDQPVLYLPYFHENSAICPATVVKDYIFVTNSLRCRASDRLILTYQKPHKPATAQSISRWIKQVLSASGVEVATFSAHSTRHAATSAARAAGLSLDAIRKAAGWTSSSQTFARFYNRPISDEDSFARSVLLPNSSL